MVEAIIGIIVGGVFIAAVLAYDVILDMYGAVILGCMWQWFHIDALLNFTPTFWQMFGIIYIVDVLRWRAPQANNPALTKEENVKNGLRGFYLKPLAFTFIWGLAYLVHMWFVH